MRDSRIFMIYEGTNGIQAMDLLGRKLAMKKGKSFGYFLDMMAETVKEAKDVAYYAGQMKTAAFFINTLLPSALAKMDAIVDADTAAEEMPEISFCSK